MLFKFLLWCDGGIVCEPWPECDCTIYWLWPESSISFPSSTGGLSVKFQSWSESWSSCGSGIVWSILPSSVHMVHMSFPDTQGRSQPHSPGWARVPLSSFFPQILINFSYFSSSFTYFLPHFGPPGGWVTHPGRPWLRHCRRGHHRVLLSTTVGC